MSGAKTAPKTSYHEKYGDLKKTDLVVEVVAACRSPMIWKLKP